MAEPSGWKEDDFDDSAWPSAIVYSESEVSPKDGYDQINWNSKAQLIWGSDLEQANTILCRVKLYDNQQTSAPASNSLSNDLTVMQESFEDFNNVSTSIEDDFLKVSSDGIPNHNMMVGIKSWQQQVGLPQDYSGSNSWSIPLNPVLADEPMMLSEHFMKGAVAIAVNGIPIFNPLNNRGEFASDVGELDEWGGHSGKADDYHYHLAPTHLESIVGTGNPIAYAFDGFPIYGETEEELDEYLGRFSQEGSYQYHAINTSPYFIAGFRGEVNSDSLSNAPEDQVVPQPRSTPVRTADYGPLKGAEITNFSQISDNTYSLEYTLKNETYYVNYSWDANGNYKFDYIDADGSIKTENFQSGNSNVNSKPPTETKAPSPGSVQRKFCGDGICDNTENANRCALDCS